MAVNNTGGSFLDELLRGIKQIAKNFVTLPQRPTLNFIGFPAVVDNPSMGTTDVYGTSGSTGGGITIIENNGSAMPSEPALNFVGFVLGDDPGNSRTNVALPSPGTTAVANGGTGRTSLTSHAILLGEGGSPIGFAVPTSAGFVLTDHGPGIDPTFAAPPSGLPGGTGIVEVTSGVGGVLAIPLDVAHGGTGDTVLTNHAVLLGRGTGTVGFAAPTSSGFVLTDNGPGTDPTFQSLSIGDVPPPGATISGNTTLSGTDTWRLFNGGSYAIDLKNLVPGRLQRLTHVGSTLLELTSVSVTDSSSLYVIEYPSDRSQPDSTTQSLDVSYRTYEFMKDSTNGVIRCVGFA